MLIAGLQGLGLTLPASKLLLIQSGSEAKVVTESMQQRIVTICDPTGEWVWTGAKVMESVDAKWEGTWRKRAADEKCGDIRFMEEEMLAVGPILIPAKATSYAFQWEGPLPADWAAAINETIAKDCDSCFRNNMRPVPPIGVKGIYGRLRPFLGDGMPSEMNQQFVSFDDVWGGIGDRTSGANVMTPEWVTAHLPEINKVAGSSFTGTYEQFIRTGLWSVDLIDAFVVQRPDAPVFLAQHPISKKEYGIFMSVVRRDLTKPWDSTTNPHVLQFVWRPVNKSWVTKAWGWVKKIIIKVIKFAKDTFCSLATNPATTATAMQSGNAYAIAGTQGAAILAPMVCGVQTQVCADGSTIPVADTCPIVDQAGGGDYNLTPDKPSSALLWLAGGLGFAAGIAAFVYTQKR